MGVSCPHSPRPGLSHGGTCLDLLPIMKDIPFSNAVNAETLSYSPAFRDLRQSCYMYVGGGPGAVGEAANLESSNPTMASKFQRNKMFLPRSLVKCGEPPWPRYSVLGHENAKYESCVWKTMSSYSSYLSQKVLLAQFSLYAQKGSLKPHLFHFHVGL